jgi:hypothetical protein
VNSTRKRRNRKLQIEPTTLHFDQVLDHVDHGVAFGLHERGQARLKVGIGQCAER